MNNNMINGGENNIQSSQNTSITPEVNSVPVNENTTSPGENNNSNEKKSSNKGKVIIAILLLVVVVVVFLFLRPNGNNNGNSSNSNSNSISNSNKEEITIKFDSDGGSEVNDMNIKKGESIVVPIPAKEGYKFEGWYDGDTRVDSSTKFDKDVTLVAKWTKDNSSNSNSNSNSNSASNSNSNSNSKSNTTLKCPSGYTLSGTKCTIEEIAKTKCEDGTNEYDGKCIKLNYSYKKESIKDCGTKIINKGNGQTPSVKGTLLYAGYNYCAYEKVNDSYEQASEANCKSRSHKWTKGACYYDVGGVGENVINTCSDSSYMYITTAISNSIRANSNLSGCFPVSSKIKYCSDGYTLKNNICVKTIDATK